VNWKTQDSGGWRRQASGWLRAAMLGVICGCAPQNAVSKLDPALLPAFPEYEMAPIEIPCGTERCLVIRKADQLYLIKWMKAACFTLTGDRVYCGMEPSHKEESPAWQKKLVG
jgi:hypothetical protein